MGRLGRLLGVLVLGAGLAGCVLPAGGGSPVRFYGLVARIPPAEADGGVALAVRRVTIPPYLDRQQMVVREPPTRFRLVETHNWLEPLQAAVARVFAEDLARLLASTRVYLPEQDPPEQPDLEITLDVFGFEAVAGRAVRLDARVRVARRRGAPVELRARITMPVSPPGSYEAMALALSDALAELARRTADALRRNR